MFRKKLRSVTISDEAYSGLQNLARIHNGASPKDKPNVSRFLELIGLYLVSVEDHSEEHKEYIDELGLSESICHSAGVQDAMQQKTPQFLVRFGSGKNILLARAYMRGYSSVYVDSFTTSLQGSF